MTEKQNTIEKQNTVKEQNKINDKEFPEGRKIPEKKKIFLIGFMGCGKSTVASGLEALFGFRKIEMDKEIESREGRTISRIFAEDMYFTYFYTAHMLLFVVL